MIRFYSPDIQQTGRLPEDESSHCVRVLRMREGADIETVDGAGNSYSCVVTDANPRGVYVEITERRTEPKQWNGRIVLAVAPTKNADRMEWLVEKVTEMGVDEIVLLRCEHSERKVMKTDRLQRIMVSAMKQSLKAQLPVLRGPVDFKEFMTETAGSDACKVFGYCAASVPRRDFGQVFMAGSDLTVMIGPEGDFSPAEVEQAMSMGYLPVTFGKSRLRTETAALYAVAAFHVLNNKAGLNPGRFQE